MLWPLIIDLPLHSYISLKKGLEVLLIDLNDFQDEDETSFAQEMTVPRSYSDGNLVRSVS